MKSFHRWIPHERTRPAAEENAMKCRSIPNALIARPSILLLGGVMVVGLGLSGCRLECLGDGPTTFDSLKLLPQSMQTVAGGTPVELRTDGQVHCVGQTNDFQWSLEPLLGEIQPTNNPNIVSYRPPATIAADTDVRVVVRFHGYAQNNSAAATIRVLKP